jgi:hypothetical protein
LGSDKKRRSKGTILLRRETLSSVAAIVKGWEGDGDDDGSVDEDFE